MRSAFRFALLGFAILVSGCSSPPTPGATSASTSPTGAFPATPEVPGILSQNFAPVGAPTATLGDHWELQLQTGSDIANRSYSHLNATWFENTTIGVQSTPTVRLDGTTSRGNLTIRLSAWSRRSDQAALRTLTQASYRGVNSTTEAAYLVPCPAIQWPLAPGKTWAVSCQVTTTTAAQYLGKWYNSSTTQLIETHYAVQGQTTVRVPAGSFSAIAVTAVSRITSAGQPDQTASSIQYYAPQVCNVAKTVTQNSAGNTTAELLSYGCAHPVTASPRGP